MQRSYLTGLAQNYSSLSGLESLFSTMVRSFYIEKAFVEHLIR
jgi:hypothetical protein